MKNENERHELEARGGEVGSLSVQRVNAAYQLATSIFFESPPQDGRSVGQFDRSNARSEL
jgi:hypothetical protein